MQIKDKYLVRGLWVAGLSLGILGSDACAEGKSLWQKISDFFSPGETIEGDGPMFDQLRDLDSEIGKVEGKYSRERRQVNKRFYQKQLDSLQVVRDSLVVEIKKQQAADSVAKAQNVLPKSGVAEVRSSASVGAKSSDAVATLPTSSEPLSSAATGAVGAAPATASVASVAPQSVACAHDTVYVRDTVYVHDTLYVMLANKPVAPQQNEATSGTQKKSVEKIK